MKKEFGEMLVVTAFVGSVFVLGWVVGQNSARAEMKRKKETDNGSMARRIREDGRGPTSEPHPRVLVTSLEGLGETQQARTREYLAQALRLQPPEVTGRDDSPPRPRSRY